MEKLIKGMLARFAAFMAFAVALATGGAWAAATTYSQVGIKNFKMDGIPATTEITSTPQLAFPGVTLDDISQCTFVTQLYGPHVVGYNTVETSAKSWSLYPACHRDNEGNIDKLAVQCSVYDTGGNTKGVVLVFTNGKDGVYVAKFGKYYRTGKEPGVKYVTMAEDGTVTVSYSNNSDYRAGGIGIHGTSPLYGEAKLAFPGINLAMLKNVNASEYVAGYRVGKSTNIPATNTVAKYAESWSANGEVKKIAVQFTHPNDMNKVAVIELTDGAGGVYAEHVVSAYNNNGKCFAFDENGVVYRSAGSNGGDGSYPVEEFYIADQELPPNVKKIPNKIKVFSDPAKAIRLNDITNGVFTANMISAHVSAPLADGYNMKTLANTDGIVTNLIVEYQAVHNGYTKCVVVEFTEENGEIYATALWGPNKKGSHLGEVFYTGASGQREGTDVAEARTAGGYGVCDLRVTVRTVHEWTLDSDKNWSDIPGYASFEADEVVRITVTDADAVLTVDENANVANIEFVDGSGATLAVAEGKKLTVGDIGGIGYVLNHGTIEKIGERTVSLPFSNESKGVVIVNGGTLVAAGKIGAVTATPVQIVRVNSGSTFDLNGVGDLNITVELAEGATFVNNGGGIGNWTPQTVNLNLNGDATVTVSKNFGLLASGFSTTRIGLGSHTLTFNGTGGFWLANTIITGNGTIDVKSGTLQCARASSVGENCTLNIGPNGSLRIDGTKTLCVSNFYNGGNLHNGNVSGGTAYGILKVNGTLTPGNALTNLTLAAGATIKAATDKAQVVSGAFSAEGPVKIDDSAISRDDLLEAVNQRIPVLAVSASFKHEDVKASLSGPNASKRHLSWIVDERSATKTLCVSLTKGMVLIVR